MCYVVPDFNVILSLVSIHLFILPLSLSLSLSLSIQVRGSGVVQPFTNRPVDVTTARHDANMVGGTKRVLARARWQLHDASTSLCRAWVGASQFPSPLHPVHLPPSVSWRDGDFHSFVCYVSSLQYALLQLVVTTFLSSAVVSRC